MAGEGFKRKLAAILSADVEGYSRLMRHDEIADIETLTNFRNIMFNLIQQYKGHVVDSPADNLLAGFSNIVEVVEFAAKIQEESKIRNIGIAEGRMLEFMEIVLR